MFNTSGNEKYAVVPWGYDFGNWMACYMMG
jgi:hypothetical protein